MLRQPRSWLSGIAISTSRLRRTCASTRPPTKDIAKPCAYPSAPTIRSGNILGACIDSGFSNVATLIAPLLAQTAQGRYALLSWCIRMVAEEQDVTQSNAATM
jgi:hypothetical protein